MGPPKLVGYLSWFVGQNFYFGKKQQQIGMCTLPETNKSNLKMDGWKMIVSFWGPAQPGNLRSVSFREDSKVPPTWRIIPVSKWLVTPIYKPFRPFVRGTTPVRGLTITMVINHLQVMG